MHLDYEFIRALVIANEKSPVSRATEPVGAHCIYIAKYADPVPALDMARSKVFDILLFDVDLFVPETTASLTAFRAMPNLCLIALTGKHESCERVRWLEAGADECLSVPCDSAELIARVRATVRCAHRAHFRRHRTLQVGSLSLSLETMVAEIAGQRLDLTSYEFALLWAFARNSGKVLSREQLLELAKGSAEDAFDRSIDVQVSRLRNKLGDNPRRPRFLKTVRGVGYLMVPDSWAGDPGACRTGSGASGL